MKASNTISYDTLIQEGLDYAGLMKKRTTQYNKKIIPAFRKSFNSTKKMFRNGQVSVIELWQIHERLHDASIKHMEVLKNAFMAEIELESLMGTALSENTGTGE